MNQCSNKLVRYATGESFRLLGFQFRISCSAISYIAISVCEALINQFGMLYLKTPSTAEEWKTIVHDFQGKWQFLNAIGAIDGKHIAIIPPPDSVSSYYNYKHTNSIVLSAIACPSYECLFADVESNGRMNHSGLWNKSSLRRAIENGKMEFQEPRPCFIVWRKFRSLFLVMKLSPWKTTWWDLSSNAT